MSECSVSFPGSVSRSTISRIAIDYMKYVLYYRGQFPLPLDQLKALVKKSKEPTSNACTVDGYEIYRDTPDRTDRRVAISRSSITVDRKKENFIENISKFDEFFNVLSSILETQSVMEIVLNLGPNMMSPKELYRIILPAECSNPECSLNYLPFRRCKLFFFQEIMQSALWEGLQSDSLLPISVLLLLEKGVQLSEHMEQKSFYAFPRNCKQRIVHVMDHCNHVDGTYTELEKFENTSKASLSTSITVKSGVWVRLKPNLKGFKSYELKKKE